MLVRTSAVVELIGAHARHRTRSLRLPRTRTAFQF